MVPALPGDSTLGRRRTAMASSHRRERRPDVEPRPHEVEGRERPRGYSDVTSGGGVVAVAGQLPAEEVLEAGGGLQEQFGSAMARFVEALEAAGAGSEDILSVRIYVTSIDDYRSNLRELGPVFRETFDGLASGDDTARGHQARRRSGRGRGRGNGGEAVAAAPGMAERGLIVQHHPEGAPCDSSTWGRGPWTELRDPSASGWATICGPSSCAGRGSRSLALGIRPPTHEPTWIEDEIRLLGDAARADVPALGICFGGQVWRVRSGADLAGAARVDRLAPRGERGFPR